MQNNFLTSISPAKQAKQAKQAKEQKQAKEPKQANVIKCKSNIIQILILNTKLV